MFFRILAIGFALLLGLDASMGANLLSTDEIIGDATERIREHRTTEVSLVLMDENGDPFPAGRPVEIEQVRHDFLFGCNLFPVGQFGNEDMNASYEKQWRDLFNFATLPFYWWEFNKDGPSKSPTIFKSRIDWCQLHGIPMKGHPLAWNYRDPPWLPKDPTEAMRLQMERIQKILKEYGDEIQYWDVVNEPTEFNREDLPEGPRTLTRAIHEMGLRIYIREAFRIANDTAPECFLVINDYVYSATYAEQVVAQLVDEGSEPLYDGIGIQAHQHTGAWEPLKIWYICEQFAHCKKPIHFTETTFVSGDRGWDLEKTIPGFNWTSTPEDEARQADEVEQFYTIAFSHPSVGSISWWDLTDQAAWMGAPGGLLREDMTPKPAYFQLHHLIKEKWWTNLKTTTEAGGVVTFRCFYGTHEIRVGQRENARVATIQVQPQQQ